MTTFDTILWAVGAVTLTTGILWLSGWLFERANALLDFRMGMVKRMLQCK